MNDYQDFLEKKRFTPSVTGIVDVPPLNSKEDYPFDKSKGGAR